LISDPLLRQQVSALRSAFEDLDIAVGILLSEGDLAAGHFTARGTHTGLFAGVPPTGLRWQASLTGVFRVGHGRITDAWVTWDQLALLEQLGAVERAATVSA
jgi:predicted ester cyclase